MNPPEPVLPDPDSPVESPGNPVEDPPMVDDVGSYEVAGGERVDAIGFARPSVLSGVATALEVGATAVWVGASAGFAFISAPLAFRLVADRDVFAELTERTLARLANLTYIAGGIAVGIALIRTGFDRDDRRTAGFRGVAGGTALACIAYHQRAIVPAMTRAQTAMGGTFAGVAEDDPQRIAYRALHRRSTRTYGTALILGIVQFALAAT